MPYCAHICIFPRVLVCFAVYVGKSALHTAGCCVFVWSVVSCFLGRHYTNPSWWYCSPRLRHGQVNLAEVSQDAHTLLSGLSDIEKELVAQKHDPLMAIEGDCFEEVGLHRTLYHCHIQLRTNIQICMPQPRNIHRVAQVAADFVAGAGPAVKSQLAAFEALKMVGATPYCCPQLAPSSLLRHEQPHPSASRPTCYPVAAKPVPVPAACVAARACDMATTMHPAPNPNPAPNRRLGTHGRILRP